MKELAGTSGEPVSGWECVFARRTAAIEPVPRILGGREVWPSRRLGTEPIETGKNYGRTLCLLWRES